ncbi:beta family protein [Streptomyces sp. 7-21]|uniref:beta family protein n=1 Tax=Streptomyces sp. 7-21 TaxID=2802283 RepID=UPI00191F12C8|nr:beta family protein [Streptomyces sp. 7-21]MBL1067344.1 beta family protein [Streptomyces sp. 7-21]
MPGLLYVPVLPARQHARRAYGLLRPDVRAALAPLWNLPPCPGVPVAELGPANRPELREVRRLHRHHHGWIDAPFAEEQQAAALTEIMAEETGLAGLLRPVTGPGRSPAQQSAALAAARRNGTGLGVRVRLPGEWDSRSAEDVARLLAQTGGGLPVDLLLDLGEVLPSRPGAGKEALRALDTLWPLAPWRTGAVLGGGFPRVTAADFPLGALCRVPRTDWQTWRELRTSARPYVPHLTYGDYGIQPARGIANRRTRGGIALSWGVLGYTTDDSFVLCRVVNQGPDRAAAVRGAARMLRGLPEFRGAAASEGERWLRDCAAGSLTDKEGTGQVAVWLRMGNVQHMTHVVQSLTPP